MGALLSYSEYPGLDQREQGMPPNSGYGAVESMRCHAVEGGLTASLSMPVALSDIKIAVEDASGFPDTPFTLQAGVEQMRATLISGDLITVTRSYNGTRASTHPAGRMVFEARDRYVYLLADHPVRAVGAVYVDGSRLLEGYTPYTGQPGDELQGYEGKAVVALDCSPYVGRQFNVMRADALARAKGREEAALPVSWSSLDIVNGSETSFAQAGDKDARPTAWVAFERAFGAVMGQRYNADLENLSLDGISVRVLVRKSGGVLIARVFQVPALTRKTLTLWRGPGQEDDELVLSPMSGQLRVYSMTKVLTLDDSLEPEPIVTLELPPAGPLSVRTTKLSALGRQRIKADYPQGPTGTVRQQRHYIEVTEVTGTSEARVRLVTGSGEFKEAVIRAGLRDTISIVSKGGDWGMTTQAVALRGEVKLTGMGKSVEYYPGTTGPAREISTASSARIVVGEDVCVDAELAVDLDGSYAGVGTLIERPDHVMRHFLTNRMGFGADEIDKASFDAAGASYFNAIAGGYRLAFLVGGNSNPSELLMQIAWETRSTVSYDAGKWKLKFLPDIAPAPVKTIGSGELAGEGSMFVFDRMPLSELANTLVAKHAHSLADKGQWHGLASMTNSASVAKYGSHARTIELEMVRDKATAESVLAHMLKQRAVPLLRVTFSVFYEHFDLKAGDTIEIDNPLYGSRRFFVERISRTDRFTAEVNAIEWWV